MARLAPPFVGKMRAAMAGEGEFRRFGPYVCCCERRGGRHGPDRSGAARATGRHPRRCACSKRMHADCARASTTRVSAAKPTSRCSFRTRPSRGPWAVEEIDGELVLLQELVTASTATARNRGSRPRASGSRWRSPYTSRPRWRAHCLCARVRRSRNRPSRRHARQRHAGVLGRSEADRFRHRALRRGRDADQRRAHRRAVPTYTAPEVWEGAQADRRADIYSLGVVLWQLLTGRRFAEARLADGERAAAPSAHNPEFPAGAGRRRRAGAGARIRTSATRTPASCRKRCAHSCRRLPAANRALAALLARHFDVTARAAHARRRGRAGDAGPARYPGGADRRGEPPRARRPGDCAESPARPRQRGCIVAVIVGRRRARLAAGLGVVRRRAKPGPIAAPVPSPTRARPRCEPALAGRGARLTVAGRAAMPRLPMRPAARAAATDRPRARIRSRPARGRARPTAAKTTAAAAPSFRPTSC